MTLEMFVTLVTEELGFAVTGQMQMLIAASWKRGMHPDVVVVLVRKFYGR